MIHRQRSPAHARLFRSNERIGFPKEKTRPAERSADGHGSGTRTLDRERLGIDRLERDGIRDESGLRIVQTWLDFAILPDGLRDETPVNGCGGGARSCRLCDPKPTHPRLEPTYEQGGSRYAHASERRPSHHLMRFFIYDNNKSLGYPYDRRKNTKNSNGDVIQKVLPHSPTKISRIRGDHSASRLEGSRCAAKHTTRPI